MINMPMVPRTIPTSAPRLSPGFAGASTLAVSDCFSTASPGGVASGTIDVDIVVAAVASGASIDCEMESTTSLAAGGGWSRTGETLGAGGGDGGGGGAASTSDGAGGGRTIVMNRPAFSTGCGCWGGACGRFTTGLVGAGGGALGPTAGESGESAPDAADFGLSGELGPDAAESLLSAESGESRVER